MTKSIAIGVCSCLLGEHVRYDGGHKHDQFITGTLSEYFTFVPVCPEVGCGLQVPREAMRLEGDPVAPRLVTCRTHIDMTDQMLDYCARKVIELEQELLCGFIFKERSPSCGLVNVNVYNNDQEEKCGIGLFAAAMVRHFPLLPMVEDECLDDHSIRENFIERVLLY